MIKQLLGSPAVRPNDSNEIVETQCFNKVGTFSGIKKQSFVFQFYFHPFLFLDLAKVSP
jgi:hypothetical protein